MNNQVTLHTHNQASVAPISIPSFERECGNTVFTHAERTFRSAGFDHAKPLPGTLAEGGMLWVEAQKIGATYDRDQRAIIFRDTSKILFESSLTSMYKTTYTVVDVDKIKFNIRMARYCSMVALRMVRHQSPSLAKSFRTARDMCLAEARNAYQLNRTLQTN